MLLKRFYDDPLAQASYLIGSQRTGEAIVVDPNRDVEQYIRGAEAEGLRLTHVAETHIHADFVSGARELSARTGAQLVLSGEGGTTWRYEFAEEAGARLVGDGDAVKVGEVELRVLHTPGHTPEHLGFLVTDTAAAAAPMGVLTGDFVFVGDVGRPDLLERAAKVAGSMEESARVLFRSLQAFRSLPDHVQIWPGHGAGSACGKSLGAVPASTVGYEKLTNWAFGIHDEETFVRAALDGQPDPPAYFARMKQVNREGPALLGGFRRPERRGADALDELARGGALVVDTRPAADFAVGHVPSTINIPLGKSFPTWMGALVPYDRDVYLIADDRPPRGIDDAVRAAAMIGLDRVAGWFAVDAVADLGRRQRLARVEQLSPTDVPGPLARGEVAVIDVRSASEWEAGHLPAAPNIPLGELLARLDELPRDRRVVLQCQSGGRSSIAASLLLANGFRDVANLTGGYVGWARAGLPTASSR